MTANEAARSGRIAPELAAIGLWAIAAYAFISLASFDAGPERVAYIEPVAVGDVLPDMPLFLKPEVYVPAPLEATYQTTWSVFPAALKEKILARAKGM